MTIVGKFSIIDADRASLAEISAAISIFPQTFTQTLSESLRESRPIVSEFVVHRFSAAYRLRLRFSSSIEVSAIVLNWQNVFNSTRAIHELCRTVNRRGVPVPRRSKLLIWITEKGSLLDAYSQLAAKVRAEGWKVFTVWECEARCSRSQKR
jgi:hypothetical protein